MLAALSEAPQHGYGLVGHIERLSAGRLRVRPGNLYRVLFRLSERGLVEETSAQARASEDERRRYFRITRAGRRAVREDLALYAGLHQHVTGRADA